MSIGLRSRLACVLADAATWASQKTGRGSGGMIGGLIANAIDPKLLYNLGQDRPAVLVTGTNGKSTTTRMLVTALRQHYSVATNEGGDNMDAGVISALLAHRDAQRIALEVDELHVPAIADKLDADMLVLLNLTRDQLDRVGEINSIERTLRACVEARPDMIVIANCDDPIVTSVAWDSPRVVWVSAGAAWTGDSVSSPRGEGTIIRGTLADGSQHWYATKTMDNGQFFQRPTPQWSVDTTGIHTPEGRVIPLNLSLPGNANRGNATQAVAAAVQWSIPEAEAVSAVESVSAVAGRYTTVEFEGRHVHLLLAKNPAGWQESLSMVDRDADSLIIAVNGQEADGKDLSWLWDVQFEDLDELKVVAAGERGADLAVRLGYAGVEHSLVSQTIQAIRSCPPGAVEVIANYTAFRDLKRVLARYSDSEALAGGSDSTQALQENGQ